jgi:hypothetical protein
MKTQAQLTHSKTQTHGSNFDKCTHVPTKEMLQYDLFLQVSHTWACTSSNWQQWSYEFGHQYQFNFVNEICCTLQQKNLIQLLS